MRAFEKPQEFGDYRLFGKVAEGGMAEVFLALSTKKELEGQFLAIKMLHKALNDNKAFVNLLIHEAKIGVLLNHPSIAEVFDLGSYHSEFFIAMEYVHGKSLDRLLERIAQKKAPPLSLELATFITCELLRGLAFAHDLKDKKGRELNIVHRDVSPGNILLEYKGNIKLTDFGIATAESRLQLGFTRQALGKLSYMPPEQAVNDPVTRSSDLYSLAIVYHEMITGKLPYESESQTDLYRQIVDGELPGFEDRSSRVTEELASILTKAMDKSERKRYQTAPDFFHALNHYFKSVEQLDFDSRSVRGYYRKKLAEYLRLVFQEDIISELEIIQKALQSEVEPELKITAPQHIPENILTEPIDLDEENTIFQPDHSDEATRHYPLEPEERKAILSGLPPKEALSGPDENLGFEMKTVPDYDLNIDDSKFSAMTVEQKLDISSLKRHEREELEQQLPEQEINDSAALEGFESITFSGLEKRASDIELTISSTDQDDTVLDEEIQLLSNRKPRVKPTGEPMPPSQNKKKTKWHYWVLLVGVLLVVASVYVANQSTLFKKHASFTPTQQVSISFTGSIGLQSQQELFNRLIKAESTSLQAIEGLFNRTFRNETSIQTKVLQLLAHDPVIASQSLQPNSYSSTQEAFAALQQIGFLPKSAADASLFVYFTDVALVEPVSFYQTHPVRRSLIFISPNTSSELDLAVELSQQIALMYGARLLFDQQTDLPLIPDGLAEPEKTPQFPQEKAALMAKKIALGPLEARDVTSFDQFVISPSTLHSFGWTAPKN